MYKKANTDEYLYEIMIRMSDLPPIFIINLETSTDRRAVMEQAMNTLNLPHEFIAAVDGRDFDPDALPAYNGRRRRLCYGRDLTPGEIGCILSHRSIYEKMVAENIPCAVILEDDALFTPEFPAVLRRLKTLETDWDMIRFLGREKCERKNRKIAPLIGQHMLARVTTPFGGAYAYMLTQHTAKKLLQFTQKNWMPIDILHSYVWYTGLTVFSVTPSPACADNDIDSTIESARWDKTTQMQNKWEHTLYPVTRLALKLYEMIGKTVSDFQTRPADKKLAEKLQTLHKPNG